MINDLITNIKFAWFGIFDYFNTKIITSLLSPLGVFLFGVDHVVIMKALVAVVIIDFITGLMSAKTITSKEAVRSAYKLAMYGLLVAAGHLTEVIVPGTTYLEEIVTSFLAVTELISILENIGKMGYAIPNKLLKRLQEFRDSQ